MWQSSLESGAPDLSEDIGWNAEVFRTDRPVSPPSIPITRDSGGALFCLGVGNIQNVILYEPFVRNGYVVSAGFEDFIDSLRPLES